MFRKLFTRVFVNTMMVLFVVLMTVGSMLTNYIWRTEYEAGINELKQDADAIAKQYNYLVRGLISGTVFSETVRETTADSDIWLLKYNLKTEGVQFFQINTLEKAGDDVQASPQTIALFQEVIGYDVGQQAVLEGQYDVEFGYPVITVAMPLNNGLYNEGVIFFHRRLTLIRADLNYLYQGLNPAILMAVLVGLVLSYAVTTRITRPLREMSNAARRLADGDMTVRVHLDTTQEINELAMAFNSMVKELSEMEDIRKGFVANVSHELRSPITSIAGYLQGMLDGTIPQEDHPKYMKVVLDETQRLSRLIRDLLDLSRIESGSMPLNMMDFELNELLRRVLIKFEGQLEEKNMGVEIDFAVDPLMVNGDIDRVEQVVSNLVDNALKYCGQYGTVTMRTVLQEKCVQVWVCDDGAGIPAEDLPHVFERFYKADKAHTSGLGTGLGLSIVKKIVEQHGQVIGVESEEGEGARFYFTLALGNPAAGARPENRLE